MPQREAQKRGTKRTCACVHIAYVYLCSCCVRVLVFILRTCTCVHVAYVCLCSRDSSRLEGEVLRSLSPRSSSTFVNWVKSSSRLWRKLKGGVLRSLSHTEFVNVECLEQGVSQGSGLGPHLKKYIRIGILLLLEYIKTFTITLRISR